MNKVLTAFLAIGTLAFTLVGRRNLPPVRPTWNSTGACNG